MGSKSAFSASLLLIVLCTNILGAFSQLGRCTVPLDPVYAVDEIQTTPLGTTTIGGTDVINTTTAVRVWGNCGPDEDINCYVKATVDNRLITFTPILPNFTDYLDFDAGSSNILTIQYEFFCIDDVTGSNNRVLGSATFNITDTNNRVPEFTIDNPHLGLNLETWESQNPINFRTGVRVFDRDFSPSNSNVTLRADKDIILIQPGSSNGPREYIYNFYLNAATASPGNHTIVLMAADGLGPSANARNATIYLYIAGGAQYQATALTVLLVALATWFNLK